MSPTHGARAEATSPSNYYYPQTQAARAPLSIQTYASSSHGFSLESERTAPSPYGHAHTVQQPQSKSVSSSYPPTSSPTVSKAQVQSPLSGLEALVQAATEERRRLSGGSEPGGVSAMRMSLSPVANRSAAKEYAVYQEPQFPQNEQPYRLQSPVLPDSVRNAGSEPPRKRRRSSGSPGQVPQHYTANVEQAPSPPVVSVPAPRQAHSISPDRHTLSPAPALDEVPDYAIRRAEIPESSTRNRDPPLGDAEQDAHEWFMEQYGASSRSSSSPYPSPRGSPVASRRGRDRSIESEMQQPLPTPTEFSEVVPVDSPKPPSRKSSPSTPTRALEEVLDDAISVKEEAVTVADTDVDRDIEGALGLDEPAPVPAVNSFDVEDELLSLVDDHKDQKPASAPRSPEAHRRKQDHSPAQAPFKAPSTPAPSHKRSASRNALPSAPMPEHELMPPPSIMRSSSGSKDKTAAADRSKSSSKKEEPAKSDVTTGPSLQAKKKSASKPKAPPKPKKTASGTKAKSRVKVLQDEDASSAPVRSKKASPSTGGAKSRAKSGSVARSRSTSVLPIRLGSAAPDPETIRKEDEDVQEDEEDFADKADDDKLYCICKTKYDEDKVMIACDRCDEWYHTLCVNMPDLEIDLVDTFICPPCVENNPQLSLETTYKRRCFAGLQHPSPSSPSACHKPARGALSKYCSDECGVKYMQQRIDAWTAKGGSTRLLWDSVKNAERREGVVVQADRLSLLQYDPTGASVLAAECSVKHDREVERLRSRLDRVMKTREQLKKEMEVVIWRQKLVELASDRANRVDECGWDQRLCFDDEEWAEFGAGVLESYEESQEDVDQTVNGMQVDGPVAEHGEWWCKGKKKCDRHAGWQKLRIAEVDFEKETKEATIAKLTTQERELRKRIEDILEPKDTKMSKMPLKPSNTKPAVNGHSSVKVNGDAGRKGKKRKAEFA